MIQISAKVPPEFHDHATLDMYVQGMSRYYNSPSFDRKERSIVSLHDGTHLLYSRLCGFEPKLRGPGVNYDS